METDATYSYHPHLGSASWITDHTGQPVQHLQYLTFGEPYINQRLAGYNERFTFTGKERDEETGYGYFGARYMDHELTTMWLSVAPMSDKYPSLSPYNYCAWNPVKLVDPDGRDVWHPEIFRDGTINYLADKGDTKETFMKQYGLTSQQTDAIFEKSNVTTVREGTMVTGNAVKQVTGSTVLRLNWNNATKEQKAFQAMFGILHSTLLKRSANLSRYFSNLPLNGSPSWIRVDNVEIPLYDGQTMKLQTFQSTFNREFPQVGALQAPKEHPGVNKVSQTFNQMPGGNLPRITVSYSRKDEGKFQKSYY